MKIGETATKKWKNHDIWYISFKITRVFAQHYVMRPAKACRHIFAWVLFLETYGFFISTGLFFRYTH